MENKSLKGTQTAKNIFNAFKEEAAAAVKYTIFADKSYYEEIEHFFEEVAKNEIEHAEVFLDLMNVIGSDVENLNHSIALEGFVSAIDYPESARTAKEEGFDEIASIFEKIAEIELRHKNSFKMYSDKIQNNTLLKSTLKSKWLCLKCGFIYEGGNAPDECPVCKHSSTHFKIIK